MQEQIREILKKNSLSVTASREKILGLFLSEEGALRMVILKERRVKNSIA